MINRKFRPAGGGTEWSTETATKGLQTQRCIHLSAGTGYFILSTVQISCTHPLHMYAVLHNIKYINNMHIYKHTHHTHTSQHNSKTATNVKNATHILLPAGDYCPKCYKSIHLPTPAPPRRA